MPQVRQTGTAWDCNLDDYAYSSGLDRWGWAWEFLRRNDSYRRDFRINRAGHPVAIKHVSGAVILRLRKRSLVAEKWGLCCFANPQLLCQDAHVFWLKVHVQSHVCCTLRPTNENILDDMSLASFAGHRRVLATHNEELVVFNYQKTASCMSVINPTFLTHECALSFEILGLEDTMRAIEAIQNLRRLRSNKTANICAHDGNHSKYLDYLVALDEHLAGRSYRDIAEILYGAERIGPYWTDDSRGFKLKVRRAVKRGLELMNGGYRELL